MSYSIFLFIFIMWALIIIGGGIVVLILGQISVSGFGDYNRLISSGIQAMIAIILVVLWVLILSKLKNRIFQKQIRF